MRFVKLFLISVLISIQLSAQTGVLKGKIKDKFSNDPIEFANVFIENTSLGTSSDEDGSFEITNIPAGIYNIRISSIGYKTVFLYEVEIQSARPYIVDIEMDLDVATTGELVIKAEAFRRPAESPLSLRTIGVTEIRRSPGGNRDISRVIQSLPGVTSASTFRNDLIIRGGAPNENRFFIDDVEIPVINHFATQGSSGGPAGIINVDFIREVDFYSGAYPSSRYNALSSVFNFRFKDGRDDRFGATFTVGANDFGASAEGPIGKNSTILISARRSYLQFLFELVGLPFLPIYNDFQVKYKYKINPKTELYFLGIGAIDNFKLNLNANDTESKQFILENLPVNKQWNYTNGLVLKRYNSNGYTNFVVSRSMLNNAAEKYYLNDDSDPANKTLDYRSQEIENKFRVESFRRSDDWNYSFGINYEFAKFNTNTFNLIFSQRGPEKLDYNTDISFHKYGAFVNVSRKVLNDRLNIAMGTRIDGNTYSNLMSNPLKQFSPRISLSYDLGKGFALNGTGGIYYQLPPYTTLGYKEDNRLINKENIKFIRSLQYAAGFEYNTSFDAKISIEFYDKHYQNYPFLLREGVSLANLGADFGIIGNGPALSISEGRAYGMEITYQQRLVKGFYGILAYTFGRSEFSDANEIFRPSSWDARHIVSFTGGKRLGKNWEVGVRWRFQTGLPFTPDLPDSDLVINWRRNNRAIPDFARLNELRNPAFGFLDMRVDKKWFFKSWDLNIYLDVQNLTSSSIPGSQLILDRPLDESGRPIGNGIIINPNAPESEQRFATKRVDNSQGTVLPFIGLVVSF